MKIVIETNNGEKEFSCQQESRGLLGGSQVWAAFKDGFLFGSERIEEAEKIEELAEKLKRRYGGKSYKIVGGRFLRQKRLPVFTGSFFVLNLFN